MLVKWQRKPKRQTKKIKKYMFVGLRKLPLVLLGARKRLKDVGN